MQYAGHIPELFNHGVKGVARSFSFIIQNTNLFFPCYYIEGVDE
jgi:hypothetical protein